MPQPKCEPERNSNPADQAELFTCQRRQLVDLLASLLAKVWLDRHSQDSAGQPNSHTEEKS